jgi:ribonucleoside-triphosphate reductase
MRTVTEIDADIAKVREEMQNVHGSTTEVYARIVGYYRSVRNWNRGKREEYSHRKLFIADEGRVNEHLGIAGSCACDSAPVIANRVAADESVHFEASASDPELVVTGSVERYELFVRKTCPNCPPVKECCANLPYSGEQIDVDSAEGFARASACGVFSAPTVIFYDGAGTEIARAHSVNEIRSLAALAPSAEPALSF